MLPFGALRFAVLPWLPLLYARRVREAGVFPTGEDTSSASKNIPKTRSSPNDRVQADDEGPKRASEAAHNEFHKLASDQGGGSRLQALMSACRNEAILRPSKRPRSTGRALKAISLPNQGSGAKANLEPALTSETWCIPDPSAYDEHRWLNLARAQQYSLCLRARDFVWRGTQNRQALTLGVQSAEVNYAIFCGALRWNRHSWVGAVTFGAWNGSGDVLAKAFRSEIEQRLCPEHPEHAPLQCVLTIDTVEDAKEVVWHILRPGGESVFRLPLKLIAVSDGEAVMCSKTGNTLTQSKTRLMQMTQASQWIPADPHDGLIWVEFVRKAHLSFVFRLRQFRRNGRLSSRFFTFGIEYNPTNYASPCTNLTLHGQSWIGVATRHASRGNGREFMSKFWADVELRSGLEWVVNSSLHCVLTLDNVFDPREVDWQIVQSSGESVVRVRLKRVAANDGKTMIRSKTRLMQLAQASQWAPWDLRDGLTCLGLARTAHLSLGFRLKHVRENGILRGPFLAFGAELDRSNYAFPCMDLTFQGYSWIGLATRHAWRGGGRAIMDAFWTDIEQRFGPEPIQNVSLLCVLIVDNVEDPQKAVWQIVRPSGESVVEIPLVRVALGDGRVAKLSKTKLMQATEEGQWTPAAPHANHPWLSMVRASSFSFVFRRRHFRRNGAFCGPFFTFGAELDSRNFALPCSNLTLSGNSWIGDATRHASRGSGRALMDAFWAEIEQKVGGEGAGNASLRCVLTMDDVQDPQEVVWRIAPAGDETVLCIFNRQE